MMRRFLLSLALLLPAFMAAQTTVSVNLKSALTTNVTTGAEVRFRLWNHSGAVPRGTGACTGVLLDTEPPGLKPDTNGLVSTSLCGNDLITPAGTRWTVEYWLNGEMKQTSRFNITGGVANLNTLAADTTTPVVIPPTGDNTYWRLDAGNMGSNLVPNLATTRSLGVDGAIWDAFVRIVRFDKVGAPGCTANHGFLWYDLTANAFRYCNNGGVAAALGSAIGVISMNDCAGVVYDGVTDDHTAAQACINANPKKRVYFPCVGNASGFDMFSSVALTIPSNFVSGCGGSYSTGIGTILKFGAGSGGLILTGTGVTVQDLNVLGSDPAPSTSAQAEGANLLIPAASVMNEYNKTISTIERTADVTTVRFTNVPHWFPANGIVTISGVSDTSFNGTFYIATSSQAMTAGASSFTYTQTGAPDVAQAALGGTVSLATTYVAGANGIELRQSFIHLQNVSVEKFGLNGVAVMGSSFIADDWRLDNVNVRDNRAHGFKCAGGDCNAGTALHLATYLNQLWGIYDVGFLGNTYIGPQASYNFGGAPSKPVAGATKNITAISRTASVLSVTTSTAHGFSVGHGVFFAGTSGAIYDTVAGTVGCFIATVPTTTSFTCLQPGYNLSDQGATASGTVRLGSWTEVTTGASIDGGPYTIGRTNTSGHFLVDHPYDEGGQGPNKYSGSVVVVQPHTGNGTDAKWTAGLMTSVTATNGTVIETNSQTIKAPTDNAQFFSFQAGNTADQFEYMQWKNQAGTVKWALRVDPTGGAASMWGVYQGDPNTQTNPCFVVNRGSATIRTDINAGCAQAGSGAAAVRINPGNNSGTGGLEVYSGGAVSALAASISGAGVGKFSGLTSFTAGGFDVGSAALPFAKLYLGTAATNNFVFTPAATAAARTLTINDPLANSTLRTELSGTATVDLASVANAACSADSSNVTVTGARVGDELEVTAATALEAGGWLIGRVTANDTGRFQFCQLSGGAIDRASDTYTLRVKK